VALSAFERGSQGRARYLDATEIVSAAHWSLKQYRKKTEGKIQSAVGARDTLTR
jgi:hypothetical protein